MAHLKKRYWIPLGFLLLIILISLYGWQYWLSFKQKYGINVDWHGAKISLNGILFDEFTVTKQSQLSVTSKNLVISWSQLSATDVDIYWQANQVITQITPAEKVVDDTAQNFNPSLIATFFYWLPTVIHIDSLRFYQQDNELFNLNVDVTKQQEGIQLAIATKDQRTIKLSAILRYNSIDSRIDIQNGLLTTMLNQAEVVNSTLILPFSGWLTQDRLSLSSLNDATFNLEKINISQDLMLTNTSGKAKFQFESKIPIESDQISANVQLMLNKLNGIYQNSEIKSATGTSNIVINNNQITVSTPELNIQEINVGIAFEKLKLAGSYTASFKSLNGGIITWSQARANIFSGSIWLEKNRLNLAKLPQQFNVRLKQIQLKDIFAKYPVEGLAGEGEIEGVIPITLLQAKNNNKIVMKTVIKKGQLATINAGYLQFENSALKGYVQNNPNMKILTDILKNFHYTKLTGNVDYADDIAKLSLNIQGRNEDVENGKAVNLNITLEENVAKLMMSILLSDQISEPIRKRIEARLK
ncbi:hypothetical protein A9G11_06010 [Gilliamella sp. wkB108]|uniref:intermembrane phospholipid transport protein YdbH family protein n=1 Tax=Gilliamella sp. wkB108 TaxID=3120256 RepID=UPI00080DC622|nr:YdbH domain-containing protein [Gilliamella apicola]OCG23299.1 hypothetical protein A9G11_06010 [Gilliamella apicola]